MLKRETAVINKILSVSKTSVTAEVAFDDGSVAKACAYTALFDRLEPGDRVLLNTTACRKSLGTGGMHFVIANLSSPSGTSGADEGHIVKCRYTPVQHTVMSVEEQDSPWHGQLENACSLEGAAVICGQLHSQLAFLAAALKELDPGSSLAYIMPDYSCLPIGFSRLAESLKRCGLVDNTVTCGQAFGGDYEAVNAFSAMVFARDVLKADYIAVIPGPGNAGTGTKLGFGSLDMAGVMNGAMALGAGVVCIPRICFADKRERHAGLSHHTSTMLRLFTAPGVVVPVPVPDDPAKSEALKRQINASGIGEKHRVLYSLCRAGEALLRQNSIKPSTMGHTFEDTPEFFYASSAAAGAAVDIKRGK
ncbi:MAG: DUF3866 family protein [Abditibacteriota bacterium]|nr:DUF3866 family protein [Abditibacteriota bacterium]